MKLETDLSFVRDEIAKGNRVLLLVRHAERPHMDQEDKTFGAALPLTDEGCRTALALGAALSGLTSDVQFRASPLMRTVQTAQLVAVGMGLPNAPIVRDDAIGNGSAYLSDPLEVWNQFRGGAFFDKMRQYLTEGTLPGFADNAAATVAYEQHVTAAFTAKLGIFTTHDVYLAAFLHGKGVKCDWTPQNWPRFLDAAVLVIEPSGHRRYALVRTGFSTGVIGV